MARRQQAGRMVSRRRLSTTQIILYIISALVILSMAIGFVLEIVMPVPTGGPAPTLSVPAIVTTVSP